MKLTLQTIKSLIIATIIVCIIGSITVLALGSIGLESIKVFAICLAFIIYGICGTVCMVVSEKPSSKSLGNAGMIIAMMGFILTAVVILAETGDIGFVKIVAGLFITSLGLTHICLLHHFNLQNKYAFLARAIASFAIAIFSLLLIIRIFDSMSGFYGPFLYSESTYKLTLVAFIVDLSATMLVPLCNRLQVPGRTDIDETPLTDQSEKQAPGV